MSDDLEGLSGAVRQLIELAEASATLAVDVREMPGHPDHLLVAQGNAYKLLEKPRRTRQHTIESLEDFCEFTRTMLPKFPGLTVWHETAVAILVLDPEDRRDRARLPLPMTAAFSAVAEWHGKWMKQEQLIAFFRYQVYGLFEPVEMLSLVRSLKFRSSKEISQNEQHDSIGLGQNVEAAAVTGENGRLPDAFGIQVAVYQMFPEAVQRLDCALEIDAQKAVLRFVVLSDGVANAIGAAQAVLREALEEQLGAAKIPITRGVA